MSYLLLALFVAACLLVKRGGCIPQPPAPTPDSLPVHGDSEDQAAPPGSLPPAAPPSVGTP